MIRVALLATLASACTSYAAIAVAPNGSVWIARNVQGSGGSVAHDVLVCVQRDGALHCTPVPVRVAE